MTPARPTTAIRQSKVFFPKLPGLRHEWLDPITTRYRFGNQPWINRPGAPEPPDTIWLEPVSVSLINTTDAFISNLLFSEPRHYQTTSTYRSLAYHHSWKCWCTNIVGLCYLLKHNLLPEGDHGEVILYLRELKFTLRFLVGIWAESVGAAHRFIHANNLHAAVAAHLLTSARTL